MAVLMPPFSPATPPHPAAGREATRRFARCRQLAYIGLVHRKKSPAFNALICGADAMTDAIRMTERDEDVCCRSRELVETLCIMQPVDCDLPRR
jgi:hypothetical protein